MGEKGSPVPRLQSPLPLQAMGPLPGEGTGQGPVRARQAPSLSGACSEFKGSEEITQAPFKTVAAAEAGVWSLTCVEPFSATGKEAEPLLSSAILCCKGQEILGVSLLPVTAFCL